MQDTIQENYTVAPSDFRKSGVSNRNGGENDNPHVLVIEAGRADRHYWTELWHYRELFAILAWRDIAVRYKQTIIGIAWAVIRPLMTMMVFTIVFGRIAKLPSIDDIPYPVLVSAGMLPWFLFATILTESSNSLVSNSHLLGKVYFPRLIIPCASTVVALVDFLFNLMLLMCLMLWFGLMPDWRSIFLPCFIFMSVLAGLGPALCLASLNVRYRDFRLIVPFLVQFGLYLSPVGFSSEVVPLKWKLLYSLNPIVSIIDGFRWCLFGSKSQLDFPGLLISMIVIFISLALGVRVFRRTERTFSDLI